MQQESGTGSTQWKLYGSTRSRSCHPTSNFHTCFELSQVIKVPYSPHLLLYVFLYIYLYKNNIKRSLILLGIHLSTHPTQLLGAKLHCWTDLISILPFITHFLENQSLYSCACVHFFRLLLLIITLVLCKRKNNQHNLSTPTEFRDDLLLTSVYTAKPLTTEWLLYDFHFRISL